MSSFIRLNTIFVPGKDLTKKVLDIATLLTKKEGEIFHIDNKHFFAHLTIYSPEYPIENLNKILHEVREIAGKSVPIRLEFERFHSGWGYVGIEFKKNLQIEKLHAQIVETLNPLRNGYTREKYTNEIADGKYSQEQVVYIKRYGYHNLFKSYQPHLTLGRFASEELASRIVKSLGDLQIVESMCEALAVCEMGENGTCTKILGEFKMELTV